MDYGTTQYGVIQYAETVPNSEDIKKYFIDLSKYVPPFIYNMGIMKTIYNSQGAELGSLYYYIHDLLKQCFIDTATWGLSNWEEEFGIITNLSLSYEQRREILKAKKRGQGTTTKAMLKNAAQAFSGGEVNILEDNANYSFTVQFIGIKGIPHNIQAFINMLEDIKPAHLGYTFKYTYSNWDYLDSKNLTYNSVEANTWDTLEIYD
jgi:Uncharacterized protein conserved in bacteria (DUF2313).